MANKFAYVHLDGFLGFVERPESLVFRDLLKEKGIHLEFLNNNGDRTYKTSSVTHGINVLDSFYQRAKKPLRVVGISMGATIAALYASLHPGRVDSLLLMNPGLKLEDTWPRILQGFFPDIPPEEFLRKWKEANELSFFFYAANDYEPVGYEYYTDSLTHPSFPQVEVPTRVYTGKQDNIVLTELCQEWKRRQKKPELMEVFEIEDNHFFTLKSTETTMVKALQEFFD